MKDTTLMRQTSQKQKTLRHTYFIPRHQIARSDHIGESLTDIEHMVPILELLIPEHVTVQENTPQQRILAIATIVTLWGHMVGTTTSGGAYSEIEQTVTILELLIPEHVIVQETNVYTMYFVISTIVTRWGHMLITTISGGAQPEIEQSVPILVLLIPEHMTV